MRRTTQRARENAAREAAKRLRLRAITYLAGHSLMGAPGVQPPAATVAWLAGIAGHIGSLDPIEIGAGALLEARGYERSNEQLTLTPITDAARARRGGAGRGGAAEPSPGRPSPTQALQSRSG